MTVARVGRPRDGRVEGHVPQLIEVGVEPSAELGGGPLEPGEVAVGGVEHQGDRERGRRQPRAIQDDPPKATRPVAERNRRPRRS